MKKTIKDQGSILPPKIRALGDLVRPFTLVAAFLCGVFVAGFSLLLSGQPITPHLFDLIYVGITLALLQGGGQAINMSYSEEIEIDRLNNKDYRPVPDIISPEEGLSIGFLLILFGVARGFTVNTTFGLFSTLIAFFSVYYTLPPFRIKRFLLLNNLHQGFSRGFLPIWACFSVFNSSLNPVALGWATVTFLWASGGQASKDFGDERGDKSYNIRTCPIVLGRKLSVLVIGVFMALSFLCLSLFTFAGVLPFYFIWTVILIFPSILMLYELYHGPRELDLLENNLPWVGFYLVLGLWFLLPPILEVIT